MMKNKGIQVLVLVVVAIILAVIILGRISEARAPDLTKETVEAAQTDTLSAEPSKIRRADNADLTPRPTDPPEPTPTPEPVQEPEDAGAAVLSASEIGVLTPREEIPFTPQPVQGRYGSDYLNADEIETLARLVYLEARGESFSGQQAVAEVVLNRVLSPLYPNNVYDVIYDPGQFSPAGQILYTNPTQTQYDAVAAALTGPNILPQQVLYFACSQNGRSNVWGWIGNHCFCY